MLECRPEHRLDGSGAQRAGASTKRRSNASRKCRSGAGGGRDGTSDDERGASSESACELFRTLEESIPLDRT